MPEPVHYPPLDARPTESSGGGSVTALVAGGVAALLGGLVWAGIAIVGNLEIGWVAWGIGWVVAAAMGRMTASRSTQMGISAAALAAGGLIVGKLLIFSAAMNNFADLMIEEEGTGGVEMVVAYNMYENQEFDEATQTALAALGEEDMPPPELEAAMQQQVEARLASLSEDEQREILTGFATMLSSEFTLVDRIKTQLGLFDILWFGLALATAYTMMSRSGELA